MAVTVVGTPTELSDSSSPFTFAGATHTSGSGTNRAIVAAFVLRSSGATVRNITGVTWNTSEAMTFAGKIDFNDATANVAYTLELWYLLNPTADTAGGITVTPDTTPNRILAHFINIEGSGGAISFDAFGSGEDDDGTASTAVSASITTGQANTLVIGAAAWRDGTIAITWTDMTENADSIETGDVTRLNTSHAAQASAGAFTYDGTLGGSGDEWGFVLASFYETAGGDVIAGIKGSALRSSVFFPHAFGQGHVI